MSFSFEVDGQERLTTKLGGVAEYLSDFRPAWGAVEEWFFELSFNQFLSEGAKGATGRWKDLSPKYKERKRKEDPIFAVLQSTGALKRALSQKGAARQVREMTATEFRIGTDLPYAVFHQRGTRKMPARPPIDPTNEALDRLRRMVRKPLQAFVRQSGFEVMD